MDAHHQNAKRPIEGPDDSGAFPAPGGRAWGLFAAGVPPVVVDANPLRNDILRACRTGRTVLVTAANVGALHLYVASHVVVEIHRHGDRWARESGDVSPAQFWACWRQEYIPLLRVVDDRHLSADLLGRQERARLNLLAAEDPDDVPSVILALALDAFFLSEDHAAVRAVYGEDVDLEAHRGWLAVLRSSGDAGELGKMVFAASMLPAIMGGGAIQAGRWVSRKLSPWALVSVGLGLLLLAHRHLNSERMAGLRDGAGKLAWGFAHIYLRYQREYERFRAATPATPVWSRLTTETDRPAVLRRACIFILACSPSGHRSVSELAGDLAALGVGQDEAFVREVLRASGCFQEVYAGRWQLGSPAPVSTTRPVPEVARTRVAVRRTRAPLVVRGPKAHP